MDRKQKLGSLLYYHFRGCLCQAERGFVIRRVYRAMIYRRLSYSVPRMATIADMIHGGGSRSEGLFNVLFDYSTLCAGLKFTCALGFVYARYGCRISSYVEA